MNKITMTPEQAIEILKKEIDNATEGKTVEALHLACDALEREALMTPAVRQALENVLDMYLDDEQRHYEELSGEEADEQDLQPSEHIYHHLRELENYHSHRLKI